MKKSQDVCSHKISFLLDNFIRRILQNPSKITGEYLKEGNIAIDLGCGPGFFTIDMARKVGDKGEVIAVDLQPEMLSKVKKKVLKNNLQNRVAYHRCEYDKIGLPGDLKADFILVFYMLHETPDPENFLKEVKSLLKEGGKVLVVEPKFHVSEQLFKESEEMAIKLGFKIMEKPSGKGGRAIVLSI